MTYDNHVQATFAFAMNEHVTCVCAHDDFGAWYWGRMAEMCSRVATLWAW